MGLPIHLLFNSNLQTLETYPSNSGSAYPELNCTEQPIPSTDRSVVNSTNQDDDYHFPQLTGQERAAVVAGQFVENNVAKVLNGVTSTLDSVVNRQVSIRSAVEGTVSIIKRAINCAKKPAEFLYNSIGSVWSSAHSLSSSTTQPIDSTELSAYPIGEDTASQTQHTLSQVIAAGVDENSPLFNQGYEKYYGEDGLIYLIIKTDYSGLRSPSTRSG